jgi:hypothetical protein
MTKHPPEAYRRASEQLLLALLGDNKELATQWWTKYNKHWKKTPEEAFKDDPMDVYEYLVNCAYGGW